jgi:anti-sigma factor RsiW
MSHKPYLDWMHLALDEALTARQRAELDGHLAECAACAATWDALTQVDRLFAPAALAVPRPGFSGRFSARLKQQRARPRAIWGALALGFGAVGAASVVLPLGVSLLWSLAQLVGQPAASAALLNSASATSEVGLALARALFVAALALGEWAVWSPVAWAVFLGALLVSAGWVYMLRRVSVQRMRS